VPRWLVHEPMTLDFDGVVALRVRLMSGSVAVLGTQDRPCLDVAAVTGQALPGAGALGGTAGGGSGRPSVTTMSGQVTLAERDPPGAPPGSAQAEGDI
jgi:hypothetical protein